jgi:ABC-type lipoprotein release transport system permease subunit
MPANTQYRRKSGQALAQVASRIEPLLFQVRARDPLTLAGAALTLILVGALASWMPAIRATRVDPSRALRAD